MAKRPNRRLGGLRLAERNPIASASSAAQLACSEPDIENACDHQANDSHVRKGKASNKSEKHERYYERTDPAKNGPRFIMATCTEVQPVCISADDIPVARARKPVAQGAPLSASANNSAGSGTFLSMLRA